MNKVFFDTNVFVYARLDPDGSKPMAARDALLSAAEPYASTQVLIEFVSVARKRGVATDQIEIHLAHVTAAMAETVPADEELVISAIGIVRESGISWFDSLIVAAAAKADCETLVTEDLNDGQIIAGVTVFNPFQ